MGVKSIGCGFHNINGLKTQGHRLEFLSSWAANERIDLIGIAETNLKEREAKFLAKNLRDFSSFWSSAAPDKYKGSGVGLLVRRDIEKHLGRIERCNEYLMWAKFFFKKCKLLVITAYLPPNDEEKTKIVAEKIKEVIKMHNETWHIILMGDFNHIPDKALDKFPQTNINKKFALFTWLEKNAILRYF